MAQVALGTTKGGGLAASAFPMPAGTSEPVQQRSRYHPRAQRLGRPGVYPHPCKAKS